MFSETPIPSTPNPVAQGISIFLNALLVFILTLLIKLLIKARYYKTDKWLEVKFDFFRMGVDLSFIGLTTYFAAYKLTEAKVSNAVSWVKELSESLVYVQAILLLGASVLTAFFDEATDPNWWKGVYIPLLIGGFSIIISVFVFFIVVG